MRFNNLALFVIPALIWGSTWFVITFQLTDVDPLASVIYRFFLASIIMFVFCWIRGINLKFSMKEHLFMMVQGFFLFGANYWLVYEAEQYIASALVAVAFSTVVFMNSFFGAILLGRAINKKVIVAALAGLLGTILIFWGELSQMEMNGQQIQGTILAIASVVLASLGNIASARNSQAGIPVIPANTFGMLYGSILMLAVALLLGRTFTFDTSASYLISLGYLSMFGSVVAFGTYLTLISRIGADKAAYTLVVIPVIAIVISVIFEGYVIGLATMIGVVLILAGNVLALKK